MLHVPAPERALVVGCSDGDPVFFLAREFPAARVRGVDRSADRVRAASRRVGLDPEGRVAFKLGTPGRLPYPDQLFDLLVQLDGRPVPREATRVLKPAGHLVLVRSRPPRFGGGAREWILRRHLAARGIELLAAEAAGDGNFTVARLVERS